MRTRSLDAVLASRPLNATAGRVVAQRGEHYEPPQKWLTHAHSDIPLPLKSMRNLSDPARNFLAELMSKSFGRLAVLGIYDDPNRNKNRKAAYVVRCTCGRYEARTRRGLLAGSNPQDGEDRCSACWALVRSKKRYERKGGKPLENFTNRGNRF